MRLFSIQKFQDVDKHEDKINAYVKQDLIIIQTSRNPHLTEF